MNRGTAAAQRGLSVPELLVTILVSTALMAATYRLFVHFQKQTLAQGRIAQTQSQLFPAQASLEKNLRRAGSGIPMISKINVAGTPVVQSALQLSRGAGGSDTLIVRGNFTNVKSQLINPVGSTAASVDLQLLAGTAAKFAQGDYVVLAANGESEHVRVAGVNAGNSTLRTDTRINNYPAGTTVDLVISVKYLVAADSSLRLVQPGRNVVLLDKGVAQLNFKLVGFDGQVSTAPPWISLDIVQFVAYTLRIRIPKVGGRSLDRTVSGKILLRNI